MHLLLRRLRLLLRTDTASTTCACVQDAGCVPALSAALVLPGLIATASASALCSLCRTSRALTELAACDGCSRLVSAVAQPKYLTARGQRQGLRLLRRLVQGPSSCRAAVQDRVAALGIVLG